MKRDVKHGYDQIMSSVIEVTQSRLSSQQEVYGDLNVNAMEIDNSFIVEYAN